MILLSEFSIFTLVWKRRVNWRFARRNRKGKRGDALFFLTIWWRGVSPRSGKYMGSPSKFCRHLQPFVGLAHCDDDDKCDTCAIVIAPDYAYPRPGRGDGNLRADFHQYLIDAGVLPTPLPVGQEHILDLKRALDNKGAHVTLLRDNATALEVVRTIKCHANRCKTLLVYFCGHGSRT